jgi:transcription elongation factor/antiterminator RfaH
VSTLCWYVIQSHPRKERFVQGRIQDLEREVFLPIVSERRQGHRRATLGPLFPGYLFARLSPSIGDLARVRWTQGVRRVLGDGKGPRPVDDRLIEAIRAQADATGRVRLGRGLRRGERVRVVDGPLAGLLGILERVASTPAERVCVLLDVFSRSTRVELPAHAIRRAGS